MAGILERTFVLDLVANKGMLISIPEAATIEELLKTFSKHNLTAVPVARIPGNSGSSDTTKAYLERDSEYIGLVSMLDVVLHLAQNLNNPEKVLGTSVANIIGQTNESRSLWTILPSARLHEALQYMCQGVHYFLVPILEIETEDVEKSRRTTFRLLTQTDVVRFLLQNLDELGPCVSRTVEELGLLNADLLAFAVPSKMTLVNALRLMRQMRCLRSIGVVEPGDEEYSEAHPSWVRGGKLLGTLSVSSFQNIDLETWKHLVVMTVGEFLTKVALLSESRPLATCRPTTPLATVMATAVTNRVHRVWVTDEDGWLMGVVTFSDIIGVFRREHTSFMST